MKKTIALLAAAALTAACAKDIDPDDVRAAMPKAGVIQLQYPSSETPGALSAPAVGEPSGFAVASVWTALTFNGATFWTLLLLQVITAFPPTECGTDQCTWGPWTDNATQVVWRLEVGKNGDGFDYVLAAHAADSQTFLSIIEGTAFKGSQVGRGNGDFTVNFDNARTVDPSKDDHGVLDVSYDNRSNLQIGALFMGARNDDPENPGSEFLDIAYQFAELATGGELQIMFETTDDVKNLSLRTRWTTGGAGRGDARYTEDGTAYEASQCWLGAPAGVDAWDIAYERLAFGVTEIESGMLSACGAFSSPLYSSLILP
jgi:hypothetical protein